MILHGNARGAAKELAIHLLSEENEHVEVHELRGFMADDLLLALREIEATARGTRASKYLYSMSLNPPPTEKVGIEAFQSAIERAESKLGLAGQPRAIVFHEKEDGRRHCHAVWSRIDAEHMKAIPLPFTKYRLMELSRELYIEHGWQMPRGMIDPEKRDPKNYTLAQWQQAKRIGKDPKAIKKDLQDCWSMSDTQDAFKAALKEKGYWLAKGDRRGAVVLDHRCEVYSVSKWVGLKAKNIRDKVSDPEALPSVTETRKEIANEMQQTLSKLQSHNAQAISARDEQLKVKRSELKDAHERERQAQNNAQAERWAEEVKQRQARYNRGLRGLFDRLTGKHRQIKKQNEQDARAKQLRDHREKDTLIFQQQEQKRMINARIERLCEFRDSARDKLISDRSQYLEIERGVREVAELSDHSSIGRRHGYER